MIMTRYIISSYMIIFIPSLPKSAYDQVWIDKKSFDFSKKLFI